MGAIYFILELIVLVVSGYPASACPAWAHVRRAGQLPRQTTRGLSTATWHEGDARLYFAHILNHTRFVPGLEAAFGGRMHFLDDATGPDNTTRDDDYWLRDRKPIAFTTISNGRRQLIVASYDNPGYETMETLPPARHAAGRPEGSDPRVSAFRVGGRTVWAVPEHFNIMLEGGNFIKTEGHVIVTDKVEEQNHTTFNEVAKEIGRVTRLEKNRVHAIKRAPGELTGHADIVVGLLDEKTNAVAIPYIPEWAIEHLKTRDPVRYNFARRLNAEYLAVQAKKLENHSLKVRRVPMLAPIPLRDASGKVIPSDNPYGMNAEYLPTVNWVHGPNSSLMVPVYPSELSQLSPEAQRRFHDEISEVAAEFDLNYHPVDASKLIGTSGSLHCITWEIPVDDQ